MRVYNNIKLLLILSIVIFTVGCSNSNTKDHSNTDYKDIILTLTREKSIGGLLLDYDIYVDGNKIGEISNNDKEKYNISLSIGEHQIYIKKGIRSKKINFIVDENTSEVKFACKTKSTIGIDLWNDYSID